MVINLRSKLIISYIVISLFIVLSLLFIGRVLLNDSFEEYVKGNQEKAMEQIVTRVTSSYAHNGTPPNNEVFRSIGEVSLSKGFILTVKDSSGRIVWCMDCEEQKQCREMILGMKHNMNTVYPGFKGEYMEKTYNITITGKGFGSITLGYYGPFYYDNSDIKFLTMLNKVYIIGGILALISAILIGYFMASKITNPIKKVIQQTDKIQDGDYNHLIEFTSNTYEVDKLIQSVNSMSDTLNKQQHIRKRLARDYAHELRTPLASLQSSLEAMIDGIWQPTPTRLESLLEETARLTRMIDDINHLVETDKDSIILTKSKFDILDLINSIATTFHPLTLEKNISINIKGEELIFYGDRDRLGQVVVNLISNAIKYSRENSKININIVDNVDKVEISFEDFGIGINSEEIPYIFEHLYRTDESRSTKGSGVGLSVVKGIVEAHRGSIKVESKENKGSKFIVILPKST